MKTSTYSPENSPENSKTEEMSPDFSPSIRVIPATVELETGRVLFAGGRRFFLLLTTWLAGEAIGEEGARAVREWRKEKNWSGKKGRRRRKEKEKKKKKKKKKKKY